LGAALASGAAFVHGIRVVLDHSCQVQRHPLSERRDDAYMTPPCVTEALLRHVKLPHRLWEPACGDGTGILDPLRAAGHEVIGSDLVDYERPDCFWRRDFLLERKTPDDCGCIISNPPYKLAAEFVAHALELSPLVVMLLRLAFLESERRCGILEERGLARILVFRKRLPMMHRRGWTGRKGNSGMAFAWFVWDRSHIGPTTIQRISWQRAPSTRPVRVARIRDQLTPSLVAPPADVGDGLDIPTFLRRAP